MAVEHGVDVAQVARRALALDGEGRDRLVDDEAGGDVVLDRKRIRGAREHRRSPGLQGLEEVRGLGGHVQAGSDHEARERPLALEPLADRSQHGHVPVGPGDPLASEAGKARVGYVGGDGSTGHGTRPCGA